MPRRIFEKKVLSRFGSTTSTMRVFCERRERADGFGQIADPLDRAEDLRARLLRDPLGARERAADRRGRNPREARDVLNARRPRRLRPIARLVVLVHAPFAPAANRFDSGSGFAMLDVNDYIPTLQEGRRSRLRREPMEDPVTPVISSG